MNLTRRSFVGAAVAGGLVSSTPLQAMRPQAMPQQTNQSPDGFDPWIEVIKPNLSHNIKQIRRLTNDRPILAVVKNNAYGLGLVETARLLESQQAITGFAVVKTEAAIKLRDSGIKKSILHMGMCSTRDGHELVSRDVQLSLYTDDANKRIAELSKKAGRSIKAHAYLDTGLGRLGMPYHRGLQWIVDIAKSPQAKLEGTFMAFTEEQDFDPKQLVSFNDFLKRARDKGAKLGRVHAASSNGVFHLPGAHFDLVRPGIALYGGYPSRPDEERAKAILRPALRLKCRVVRVAQLRTGDSAGYGRKYIAEKPTWIATLPAGHVDGVPRTAVNGQRVLIGKRTFPIVGAVSASHCILEIGERPAVRVGDLATLIGPDHKDVDPNSIAAASGASVYDVFMHLNQGLPKSIVNS